MTILAPEGWIVFTRDTNEDAPNLALLGIDGKWFADSLKEKEIYLDMVSTDPYAEISVTMNES